MSPRVDCLAVLPARRMRIFIGLAITVTAFAQQDATTPTFQAGTKLVEVDVVAKSHDAPAKGLKKEDFTLTDNGKVQTIAIFSVRSVTNERPAAAEAPLPPGTYSNRLARDGESAPRRSTVILLDQINSSRELQAYTIPRIAKYVATPHGADRLAIYTLSTGGLRVVQDLTADPDLLKRAADTLRVRDPDPRINDTTGMTRHAAESYAAMGVMGPASAVRDAMKEIARHLASVPGRKNLIWVTTAFRLYDPQLGLDFRPEIEQAAHALNNANIALHAIDARGLMGVLGSGLIPIAPAEAKGPPPSPRAIAAMMSRPRNETNPTGYDTEQTLSSLTGGRLFFNQSNAIEESIESAADDASYTYTLGFYPDENTQDSKWHDLRLRVARRGVQLRYRTTYFARREGDAGDAPPTLDQILREPLDSAELGLRAEARPDPSRPQIVNVHVNIDLHDVGFIHTNAQRTATLELSFYMEGEQRAFQKPLKIEIPDAHFDTVLAKGIDAVAPVDISGGKEALRVVVQDRTTGAAGSVTLPLPRGR